jgi:hypothetical protein
MSVPIAQIGHLIALNVLAQKHPEPAALTDGGAAP